MQLTFSIKTIGKKIRIFMKTNFSLPKKAVVLSFLLKTIACFSSELTMGLNGIYLANIVAQDDFPSQNDLNFNQEINEIYNIFAIKDTKIYTKEYANRNYRIIYHAINYIVHSQLKPNYHYIQYERNQKIFEQFSKALFKNIPVYIDATVASQEDRTNLYMHLKNEKVDFLNYKATFDFKAFVQRHPTILL
jgi:hypothetical protein